MRRYLAGRIGVLFCFIMLASGNVHGRTFPDDNPGPDETVFPVTSGHGIEPATVQSDRIDTTSGAGYLTSVERQVIIEINLMRSDPSGYAKQCLVPLRSCYQGKLLKYSDQLPILTHEGVKALDECIRALEQARPLPIFSPSDGLTLAARDHVMEQGPTGRTGHSGSDGSTLLDRLERYGNWDVSVGENISYGFGEARAIVTALLIDDGVPSRGHRKNFLDSSFRFIGVGVGPHRVYNRMCVIDFAGVFTSAHVERQE
ncbi:MAG: CAP domain-containing protein [Chlorobiaceae bacterium]|nr:CAP domain-containing protein [Chlorobiaceae bacterium]